MPDIGRSIGRALGEFRRASNEFRRTIEDEVAAEEVKEVEKDLRGIRDVVKKPLESLESTVTGDKDDHEETGAS